MQLDGKPNIQTILENYLTDFNIREFKAHLSTSISSQIRQNLKSNHNRGFVIGSSLMRWCLSDNPRRVSTNQELEPLNTDIDIFLGHKVNKDLLLYLDSTHKTVNCGYGISVYDRTIEHINRPLFTKTSIVADLVLSPSLSYQRLSEKLTRKYVIDYIDRSFDVSFNDWYYDISNNKISVGPNFVFTLITGMYKHEKPKGSNFKQTPERLEKRKGKINDMLSTSSSFKDFGIVPTCLDAKTYSETILDFYNQ